MTSTELTRLRLSLMYYSLWDAKVDEPAGRCNPTSSPAVYYQHVITVKAEIVLLPFNKSVSSAMKQSLVPPKSQLPTVSVQFVDARHSCGSENIFLWHHDHCFITVLVAQCVLPSTKVLPALAAWPWSQTRLSLTPSAKIVPQTTPTVDWIPRSLNL